MKNLSNLNKLLSFIFHFLFLCIHKTHLRIYYLNLKQTNLWPNRKLSCYIRNKVTSFISNFCIILLH